MRACVRGRAYRRRQYHPDRLTTPLRRTGRRGEGKFEPITWDEALDMLARQLCRVRDEYGHGAIHVPYGTGGYSQLTGAQTARRLLNLFGGHLGFYNSYSWGATNIATPTVYGTTKCGNERQDWLASKYILMWGWNPAEARDGTNSDWFVMQARRRGARVVCIDPRHTLSAASLADEWIPIRPGTDAAMMSAMAYVIITENLHDEDFVRRCCTGYDGARMPPGYEQAESYRDYVLGVLDGRPKTPAWAEAITAVPAATIERIAREYATAGPAVLYQGYAMQRRAYGEQVVRAGCALAAITGNVGRRGGWASGLASQPTAGPFWSFLPEGENSYRPRIPCFLWTEAVLRGRQLGAEHGILGLSDGARLESDIKLIWAVASNILINQHGNTNRCAEILGDESLVEFITVQDNFLTPSGRFADLVLPACTQFETWGLADGWKYGQEVLLMPQIVEPLPDTRSDYRICADLAARLDRIEPRGLHEAYTEGRDERGWVAWLLEHLRERWFPACPDSTNCSPPVKGFTACRSPQPKPASPLLISAPIPRRILSTRRPARSNCSAPPCTNAATRRRYRPSPSTSRNGKAHSVPRLNNIRCRRSPTIPLPASTRPMRTSTGWRKRSRTDCSSTPWTRRRERSPTVTWWGSSTIAAVACCPAASRPASCPGWSICRRARGGLPMPTVSAAAARLTY